MNMPSKYPSEGAIDSPTNAVAAEYRKAIKPLRGLTVELSAINPDMVKPFNRWCVQSESAIEEGRAPEWLELHSIVRGNNEALALVRQKCSEFSSFVEKLEQGLVGEKTDEGTQSPHSGRNNSGEFDVFGSRIQVVSGDITGVMDQPTELPKPITTVPPVSAVRRSPLVAAVAASARAKAAAAKGK